MAKPFLLLIFNFLFCTKIYSNFSEKIDSLLKQLEESIIRKDFYHSQKLEKISQIQTKYALFNHNNDSVFKYLLALVNEYESFHYDSAFNNALRLVTLAKQQNDFHKIAISHTKMGFILLSSGLFKEAIDTLNLVQKEFLTKQELAWYYHVFARAYYDLADYNHDTYFYDHYLKKGNSLQWKAVIISDTSSVDYWNYISLYYMKTGQLQKAVLAFNYLINNYPIDLHQYAIAASSLAYVYNLVGEISRATEMMIIAAIADIKSSTKETVALRNLANLLYNLGDIQRAYRYIKLSLEDASYYNARHRKIEIASILPIIEGEKLNAIEKQKKQITIYAVIISVLSIVVLIFLMVIFRQLRRIKLTQHRIELAYQRLSDTNKQLEEANKIKEEYIGYYFNVTIEYIDKLEKIQREIHRKLVTRKIEDIKILIQSIDVKKEKEELYQSFDKIFLKIFPDFVIEFNKLFDEKDKIVLKDNELLNTDLRIFALMRMGINDNEKIARILQYSVNTIYTYKTKIKNKSLVANEEFEKYIMAIKSV